MPGADEHKAAAAFAVLASPVRLRILLALRRPSTIGALRVAANGSALAARQTIQGHVDKLVVAGFVRAVEPATSRAARAYVADADALRALERMLRGMIDAIEVATPPAARQHDADAALGRT